MQRVELDETIEPENLIKDLIKRSNKKSNHRYMVVGNGHSDKRGSLKWER